MPLWFSLYTLGQRVTNMSSNSNQIRLASPQRSRNYDLAHFNPGVCNFQSEILDKARLSDISSTIIITPLLKQVNAEFVHRHFTWNRG